MNMLFYSPPELLMLCEKQGIDPSVAIDPRTELIFAIASRNCAKCPAKDKCRQVLCRPVVALSSVAPFCPNIDLLVDLRCRQAGGDVQR
jgi:hypothetical protein